MQNHHRVCWKGAVWADFLHLRTMAVPICLSQNITARWSQISATVFSQAKPMVQPLFSLGYSNLFVVGDVFCFWSFSESPLLFNLNDRWCWVNLYFSVTIWGIMHCTNDTIVQCIFFKKLWNCVILQLYPKKTVRYGERPRWAVCVLGAIIKR